MDAALQNQLRGVLRRTPDPGRPAPDRRRWEVENGPGSSYRQGGSMSHRTRRRRDTAATTIPTPADRDRVFRHRRGSRAHRTSLRPRSAGADATVALRGRQRSAHGSLPGLTGFMDPSRQTQRASIAVVSAAGVRWRPCSSRKASSRPVSCRNTASRRQLPSRGMPTGNWTSANSMRRYPTTGSNCAGCGSPTLISRCQPSFSILICSIEHRAFLRLASKSEAA